MSLWIEHAARKAQEETLLGRTRELLDVALSGADPCEYLMVLAPGGRLFITATGGWGLDGLLAEHGAGAAWRVRRSERGVEIEGRSGVARCRLRHDGSRFSPGPPRARSARLLPGASG